MKEIKKEGVRGNLTKKYLEMGRSSMVRKYVLWKFQLTT